MKLDTKGKKTTNLDIFLSYMKVDIHLFDDETFLLLGFDNDQPTISSELDFV